MSISRSHLTKCHHLTKCPPLVRGSAYPSSFGQIHVTLDQLHPEFAYFTYFTSCCCDHLFQPTACTVLHRTSALQQLRQA
jgi:hypothetical protein